MFKSRFEPLSFRVVTQNATQDNAVLIVTPLTQLMKTHVTVLMARPGPPLSFRLLHTINDDLCLAFYINPSSMVPQD